MEWCLCEGGCFYARSLRLATDAAEDVEFLKLSATARPTESRPAHPALPSLSKCTVPLTSKKMPELITYQYFSNQARQNEGSSTEAAHPSQPLVCEKDTMLIDHLLIFRRIQLNRILTEVERARALFKRDRYNAKSFAKSVNNSVLDYEVKRSASQPADCK